jgi:hypothetical protein
MKTVYVETSVVSYLTAKSTRDLVVAAHQQITREWWDACKGFYGLFVSPLVVEEARRGCADAAAKRVSVIAGLPSLQIVPAAYELAARLIDAGVLPVSAQDDAAHIALAAVHDMDYLLTWNCRHLDNAETKPLVRSVCAVHGYRCPEICTPEELMGGLDNGR